jgi:hypothetical protein
MDWKFISQPELVFRIRKMPSTASKTFKSTVGNEVKTLDSSASFESPGAKLNSYRKRKIPYTKMGE